MRYDLYKTAGTHGCEMAYGMGDGISIAPAKLRIANAGHTTLKYMCPRGVVMCIIILYSNCCHNVYVHVCTEMDIGILSSFSLLKDTATEMQSIKMEKLFYTVRQGIILYHTVVT